jgi:hypothetical protein
MNKEFVDEKSDSIRSKSEDFVSFKLDICGATIKGRKIT